MANEKKKICIFVPLLPDMEVPFPIQPFLTCFSEKKPETTQTQKSQTTNKRMKPQTQAKLPKLTDKFGDSE